MEIKQKTMNAFNICKYKHWSISNLIVTVYKLNCKLNIQTILTSGRCPLVCLLATWSEIGFSPKPLTSPVCNQEAARKLWTDSIFFCSFNFFRCWLQCDGFYLTQRRKFLFGAVAAKVTVETKVTIKYDENFYMHKNNSIWLIVTCLNYRKSSKTK